MKSASEAVTQFFISAVEASRALDLYREAVQVINPFNDQPVFPGQSAVPACDGFDVAWENIDALDDEHVIKAAMDAA